MESVYIDALFFASCENIILVFKNLSGRPAPRLYAHHISVIESLLSRAVPSSEPLPSGEEKRGNSSLELLFIKPF